MSALKFRVSTPLISRSLRTTNHYHVNARKNARDASSPHSLEAASSCCSTQSAFPSSSTFHFRVALICLPRFAPPPVPAVIIKLAATMYFTACLFARLALFSRSLTSSAVRWCKRPLYAPAEFNCPLLQLNCVSGAAWLSA